MQHESHQVGLLKSADTLESIYRNKCTQLAQNPSKELCNRLALQEATRSKCFGVNGVAVDETFKVLLDVMAMATGITSVDFDDCGLTNAHVEELVHYLYKLPHIRRVSLEGNRNITDVGGQYLLDLAVQNRGLVSLNTRRTSVNQHLEVHIEGELAQHREQNQHLDTDGASEGGDSEVLGATYDHIHHLGSLGRPLGRSGSQDLIGGHGGDAIFDDVAHDPRLSSSLARSLRIFNALMGFAEEALSILCWESVVRSASALIGIMSCLYSDQLLSPTLLLMAMLMLRRRVPSAVKKKQEDMPIVLNAPVFAQMLALVRQTRAKLSGPSQEQVCDGLEDATMMLESSLGLLGSSGWRKRVVVLSALLFLVTLVTPLAHILAFIVIVAFAHSPVLFHLLRYTTSQSASLRLTAAKWLAPDSVVADANHNISNAPTLTRSVSRAGGRLRSPSFARLSENPSGAESPPEKGPFDERFEFTCVVERLIDASVQHFSGRQFVPMVHVRYHHSSWLSTKAHRPWHWNEHSSLLTFIPGASKLSFYLYDEASDVVGAVCEGHLILDDAVSFERPMVVKLHASSTAPSLLKNLVEDINAHERADKHRLGLLSAEHAGSSAFKLERAGSLVVRICPHFEGDEDDEDDMALASPPEIVFTAATPAMKPASHASPHNVSSSSPALSGSPPVVNTARESIVRERSSTIGGSSVGGGTTSLRHTPASTPRDLGASTTSSRMVFQSSGGGSIPRRR